MTEKDWGSITNYMEHLGVALDKLPVEFSSLNELTLKEVLTQALTMGQRTWVLQSFLLTHAADTAGPKLRSKAIEALSKEVGMERSKAYDLIKINEEILSKDLSVANLPFLGISHFQKIVRLSGVIANKKLNPIKLLEKASEENWTVVQLENTIQGKTPVQTEEVWHEVTEIKAPLVDSTKAIKLNSTAEKYVDNKKTFIKIRQLK